MRTPGSWAIWVAPLLVGTAALWGCEKKSDGPIIHRKADRQATTVAAEHKIQFVGSRLCATCHEEQAAAFIGSHHDESLAQPSDDSVRAPFRGETFSGASLSAVFLQAGNKRFIKSDKDRPVKWTIGAAPLQQYLLETERGGVQVFPAAYDARAKHEGGGRWYLPDGPNANSASKQNWLGDSKNWNSSCADCHSTNVRKNFDFDANSYNTTFAEIDVNCEACHGPASRHLEITKKPKEAWSTTVDNAGFSQHLVPYSDRRWFRAEGTPVAHLTGNGDAPPQSTDELLACASCHSHREDFGFGQEKRSRLPFEERYGLSFIEEPLYFVDGQAREQVYAYGSFLQSKMSQAGVVCSVCHDPHSTVLREPLEKLCVTCHDGAEYDSERHEFHPEGVIECVDCHMPQRTFMGIDSRRDHHFSVPRPDLSDELGTPELCQTCHEAKNSQWAVAAIDRSHGSKRSETFAAAFQAAKSGSASAPSLLLKVATDKSEPQLVRASALVRWAELGGAGREREFGEVVDRWSQSSQVLLRRASVRANQALPKKLRLKVLDRLVGDANRVVRIEAALTALDLEVPEGTSRQALQRAVAEARAASLYNADRIEGVLSLAEIEEYSGNVERALELYEIADTRFGPHAQTVLARIETLESLLRENDTQEALSTGLKLFPENVVLLHKRGLHFVRTKKVEAALPLLRKAFDGSRGAKRRRYGYVYAVALHETEDWAEAIAVLRVVTREFPTAQEAKHALQLYRKKRAERP